MRRAALVAAVACLQVAACAAGPTSVRTSRFETESQDEPRPRREGNDEEDEDDDEEDSGRGVGTELLLYLPNRLFDLLEVARLGVNVGPGFGIDAEVTRLARAAAVSRTSAGLGYQGLRHLPVMASAESWVGVGPVGIGAHLGPRWHRSTADVRLELHLLIVGAHAAIDLLAIADFLGGLVLLDPEGDDF